MLVKARDLDRPYSSITYHLIAEHPLFEMLDDGYLIMKNALDWEEATEHVLVVRAFDGVYNSTFDAQIRIVVLNQNDNPPKLDQVLYLVNISEDYRSFSLPITQIIANDMDSSQLQLQYNILEQTAPFRINFQGYVYLLIQLDYELNTNYEFNVVVSDGSYQAESLARVIVNIIDENDHYPFFLQSFYQASLVENSPLGSLNVPISALDYDASPQYGTISNYSILENNVPFLVQYNIFNLPYINNMASLDYETSNHVFVFHVHAYDKGGLRSFFPAQVVINLLDSDDCPPVFTQQQFNFSLAENTPAPAFLSKLLTTDCDLSPQHRRVMFSVRNPKGLISVHPLSGTLTILKSFDYEAMSLESYTFEVIARSSTNVNFFATATVNLTITDLNEYNPRFTNLPYVLTIPEDTETGTVVFTVEAEDDDRSISYGEITSYLIQQYSISLGQSLPFSLNLTGGQLSLTEPVDYDTGATQFSISIIALDSGMLFATATLEIFISNVEDELPYFLQTEYAISINENIFNFQWIGLPQNAILQIKADNRDKGGSRLTYNLVDDSHRTLFSVDSDGFLFIRRSLDFETESNIVLRVAVRNSRHTANETAIVRVNVLNLNDIAPVFYDCLSGCCGGILLNRTLIISVSENLLPQVLLLDFSACDNDSDPMQYLLNGSSSFVISGTHLMLSEPLDYEQQISYELTITATDGKFSSSNLLSVVVQVGNVDDNDLVFSKEVYESEIMENMEPGEMVLIVSASDRDDLDALVEYSISEDYSVPFEFRQSQGGDLFITNTEAIDYEGSQKWLIFNITAHADSSTFLISENATSSVIITVQDVNEFAPMFTEVMYNGSIAENEVGVVAIVSASDRDNSEDYGSVTYSILPGVQFLCTINYKGEIINSEPFDAEHSGMIEMQVEARDGGGLRSVVNVSISVLDVNDHSPFFLPRVYFAYVHEDAAQDSLVMNLMAIDMDASDYYSQVSNFSIMDSYEGFPFVVSSDGAVKISQKLDYDFGLRHYMFQVNAQDRDGLVTTVPARVTIALLNVPDLPPTFEQRVYIFQVSENSNLGTVIDRVSFHSTDGGLTECVLSNNLNLPFEMGINSGVIRVNGTIDYEETKSYEFKVTCYLSQNTGINSSTSVRVNVININDHSPVLDQNEYRAHLLENSPEGTLEIPVKAMDDDLGNAGEIRECQLHSLNTGFYIKGFNRASSTAIISNRVSFDYEITKTLSFFVMCIDRGRVPRVSELHNVTVDILDQNDNAPKFSRAFYAVSILENTLGPFLVVESTDEDDGMISGVVMGYEISPANVPFNITSDGVLEVIGDIDYESFSGIQLKRFEFSVTAYDGYKVNSKPARVFVTILNENDNSPEPVYSSEWPLKVVELEWGTQVSTDSLFTIVARDRDRQDYLYYRFTDPSLEIPFAFLNLRSGDIILQRPLTDLRLYTFSVTVQDRHPFFSLAETNSILWNISVQVVDTNSPPFFDHNQFLQVLTLSESISLAEYPLLIVFARDNDFPNTLFSTIVDYSIVHQSTTSPNGLPFMTNTSTFPFEVTRDGKLLQVLPLDAVEQDLYGFSIFATDGGGLSSLEPVAVTVFVNEVNNYQPIIIGAPYETAIFVDTMQGTVLFKIEVSDADTGLSGKLQCLISEPSSLFTINEDTCQVILQESLIGKGYDGSTIILTIVVTDAGTPPFTSRVPVNITILPGNVHSIDFSLNQSSFEFVEDGESVYLFRNFYLDASDNPSIEYTATIMLLSPNFDKFYPPDFESQCEGDGVTVDLSKCLPNSVNLGPQTPNNPYTLRTEGSLVLLFQTWIQLTNNDKKVIVAAYSSTTQVSDQLFLIHLQDTTITIMSTFLGNPHSFNISLNTNVPLYDGAWHYVLIALLPSSEAEVYIDGRIAGNVNSFVNIHLPEQIYLYSGRTKEDSRTISSAFLWGSSVSFRYRQDLIYCYMSCSLSCGEAIGAKANFSSEIAVTVNSYAVSFTNADLQDLMYLLAHFQYHNYAEEPSTHTRSIAVIITNQRYEINETVSVSIRLHNDHVAVLDKVVQKNLFYYVNPGSQPHAEIINDQFIFSDGDTSQRDYSVSINLITPLQRLCDRLDYNVKIKLEQCGYRSNASIYNFLPISHWGLATLLNVQLYYRSSFLGYYFYSNGVLTPDMSIYRNFSFNPAKFSLTFWIQFSIPGTILHVRNQTEHFLLHVHGSRTVLNVTYSTANHTTKTYTWSWNSSNDWMHIAIVKENSHIELCIDGYICSSKKLSLSGSAGRPFNGLDVHVGAAPRPTGSGYQDHFQGALNGLGLISDYAMTFDMLSCIVACSEQLILNSSIPGFPTPLKPLKSIDSTGTIPVNGSIRISGDLMQHQLQQVLRNVAYINNYPYPLPGTRYINYTIYDGNTVLQATVSVMVLFYNFRSLQFLRINDVTITAMNLRRGAMIFSTAGIITDAKSENIDSLLMEMISVPMEITSCYRSVNSHLCPNLFHLRNELLINTNLQLHQIPNKLLVTGLGNVSHYQQILHEITVQVDNINEVLSFGSLINIRVYVSDLNGISSSTKTAIIQVTDSAQQRKRDAKMGPHMENYPALHMHNAG